MNRNVTVKINMKGVNKKLEKIAQEKYPPIYVTPGHSESNLSYSSPQKIYTSSGSVFVPTNEDLFYGKQKEGLPFGYRKIRCQHCESRLRHRRAGRKAEPEAWGSEYVSDRKQRKGKGRRGAGTSGFRHDTA